jgi:hypothetical protein
MSLVRNRNRDDIEPARGVFQAMAAEICLRDPAYLVPLGPGHGLLGRAASRAGAGLDFHENQGPVARAGDDVDFSPEQADAAAEDPVPALSEMADGRIFAAPA